MNDQSELLRRLAELELRVELLAKVLGAVTSGNLDRPAPARAEPIPEGTK